VLSEVPRPPWLASMTSDWDVVHPKQIFTERRERARDEDVHLTPSQTHGVLPQAEYMAVTGNRVVLNLTGQENMKHVEADDFIIHLRSFQGGIEYSTLPGKVSNAYTVLTPKTDIEPRFYRWVLKSSGYIQELNASTNQLRDGQSIKFADFAAIDLPLPPVEEQRRIADFLDDQVTRIGGIQAERLGQIALVDARWQAGLDEMFPTLAAESDINYVSARHRLRVLPGYAFPSDGYSTDDSQIRLLRGINVGIGYLVWDDTVYWERGRAAEVAAFELRANDLVLGMDRPWISGGMRIALVRAEDLPALLLQRVAKLIPSAGTCSEYIYWAYQASAFRHQIETDLSGVSVPHLSAEQILSYRFPDRSLSDQLAVAKQLSESSAETIRAREVARAGIALLGERKRALITAAVTGELDVTTARPIGMGKWVPNVGAGVEAPANAQASSIGGIG